MPKKPMVIDHALTPKNDSRSPRTRGLHLQRLIRMKRKEEYIKEQIKEMSKDDLEALARILLKLRQIKGAMDR